MPFIFDYQELRPGGQFLGEEGVTLLGCLSEGEIHLGDQIELTNADGTLARGEVLRFSESFSDWLALPFYEYLSPVSCSGDFCIEVIGQFASLQSPGVAVGIVGHKGTG